MRDSIQYGKEKINFEIERGNREKTVAVRVDPMGGVTVLAPRFLDEEKIREFVQKKARWILEKQERMRGHGQLNATKEFVSGESFSYLGREYRLKVMRSSEGTEESCRLVNGRLQIQINGKLDDLEAKIAVENILVNWYKRRAEEKIIERVDRFASQIGRRPQSVEIKDQKKRWGSCSRSGIIRFNWKIIMAPVSVLDYIIVHELCHLTHSHHSPEFWERVEAVIRDYKGRRDWLRQHSFRLGLGA